MSMDSPDLPQERYRPSEKFAFLVVGAGRGGTSLITALLDAHPDLEVGFELHSQECLMGKALTGPRRDNVHQRLREFVAACNADAERSACRLWGNKITTEQIFGLEDHNLATPNAQQDVLNVLFNQWFRERKIIFILRDGRACVSSKVNRAGRSFVTAADRWRYSVQCYRFLKERNKSNLCVRFEDLLVEPKATLQGVCAYLGVPPYVDDMLSGVCNPKLGREYQHGKLDTTKAVAPPIPQEHFESIRAELEYCGYTGG